MSTDKPPAGSLLARIQAREAKPPTVSPWVKRAQARNLPPKELRH